MITEKLLKQYEDYDGDGDAWSRFNKVQSYNDWGLIGRDAIAIYIYQLINTHLGY